MWVRRVAIDASGLLLFKVKYLFHLLQEEIKSHIQKVLGFSPQPPNELPQSPTTPGSERE
jgi:hypothetical protein